MFDVDGNDYVDYVLSLGADDRRPLPPRGDARGAGRDEGRLVLRRAVARARSSSPSSSASGCRGSRRCASARRAPRRRPRRSAWRAASPAATTSSSSTGCYHGAGDRAPREGRLRRRDARAPRLARRPGRPREAHAHAAVQRPRRGRAALRRARRRPSPAVIIEPVVGNMGVLVPKPGYLAGPARPLPQARRALHRRRGDDRLPRLRRAAPAGSTASARTSSRSAR